METERLRNLWPWPPLTEEQNAGLRALAPDRALGRAAAVEYLDRQELDEPEVIEVCPPIIMPIAIILILIALVGLTAGWAFR